MGEAFELSGGIDFKKLERTMKTDEVLIGWKGSLPHSESGEDISEIARKLSFGAGPQTWKKSLNGVEKTFHVTHVPARPILEDGINAGEANIDQSIGKYYQAKVEGKDERTALAGVGVTAVGEIQRFARSGTYASEKPNSKEWSDFKEGAPPWIDTGEVINSLTFIIDEGSKE